MAGEDESLETSDDLDESSWGKLVRALGDRRSLTILVFGDDMVPAARSGGDANRVAQQRRGCGLAVVMGWCWW